MATVQKFLFDTSFDEPDTMFARKAMAGPVMDSARDAPPVAEPDEGKPYAGLDRRRRVTDNTPTPEPPPDLYTAAQLDATREEGFLKGHTAALEEERASTARATAKALKGIADALDHLDAEQRAFHAELEKSATRLALAMVRRMLPAAAETSAVPEIERLMATTLPNVLDQPRLIVRVHGSLAEAIRKTVGPLQDDHAFEGRITVRPDNDLPVGDCRLEWGDGGIERDTVRLWSDIEAAVARHLDETVPPPPDPARLASVVEDADSTGTIVPESARAIAPGTGIGLTPGTDTGMDTGMEQGAHHG